MSTCYLYLNGVSKVIRVSTAGSNYSNAREVMHAYPHTSPLADTNCIILTVHQQLYMEKGDSPHFDHHHEVLENKKRSTMNVFQAIRGTNIRPIHATVRRVAANTHGPPTTHFGMHDIGAHLSVRDILELLHNGRVLVYVCISTTA